MKNRDDRIVELGKHEPLTETYESALAVIEALRDKIFTPETCFGAQVTPETLELIIGALHTTVHALKFVAIVNAALIQNRPVFIPATQQDIDDFALMKELFDKTLTHNPN